MLFAFIKQHKLPEEFTTTVKRHYIPLANQIFNQCKQSSAPYFVGINGCQGSGKSTCTAFMAEYLTDQYQLNVLVMSLDDFYLPSQARQDLAKKVHPLLATRGVPGTHDTKALADVLDKLNNQSYDISIPKFSKATDNPLPENQWQTVTQPIDIVLIEGWCWGVTAQTSLQLQQPINQLERELDADLKWRTYVNEQLKTQLQPLFQKMNFWVALQAPSFDCVYQWRLEQEQKLTEQLALKGKIENQSGVMDANQILNFIQHFQRLTVHAIETLPTHVDVTLFLNSSRVITHTKGIK